MAAEGSNGSNKRARPSTIVAFPGSSGAFSEAAAERYFPTSSFPERETLGCPNFKSVFDSVSQGRATHAVVPIETSGTGSLHSVYDLILANPALSIVGEIACVEEHCLCAAAGTSRESIRSVLSHPAILDSCNAFFNVLEEETSNEVRRVATWNSSDACRQVVEAAGTEMAAIATKKAAQVHGLEVLSVGIGNDTNSETRYVVLSATRTLAAFSTNSAVDGLKTSVAVALVNKPNALFHLISAFGLRSVNILKVESRPSGTAEGLFGSQATRHWDYLFYIDYEPSCDTSVNAALRAQLEEFSVWMRELGTFKMNLPTIDVLSAPWLQASGMR